MLHGSFQKDYSEICRIHSLFENAGITVLAPVVSTITHIEKGFTFLEADTYTDPRAIELTYLEHIHKLGNTGFSYYVNPTGKIGVSTSYELAIDQLTNTNCFFLRNIIDHPAYIPKSAILSPEKIIKYVKEYGTLPKQHIPQNEKYLAKLLQELILPGSIIAVGAIIVDESEKKYKRGEEKDILLVETWKWGNKFSIIGGKVRRNELLADALLREVKEETHLQSKVLESICTFDQIKNSGYFQTGTHKVFTDNVVSVRKRKVILNYEANSYIWVPPSEALAHLPLEPNARHTIELYKERHLRVAA